jgi:hypothetical protein
MPGIPIQVKSPVEKKITCTNTMRNNKRQIPQKFQANGNYMVELPPFKMAQFLYLTCQNTASLQ